MPGDALASAVQMLDLPAGRLYDSRAGEADEAYLPDALLAHLYAREDGSYELDEIESASLYLSLSPIEHCEIALFYCGSAGGAREVASLLSLRLSLLESTLGEQAVEGRIAIRGRYVLFVYAADAETIESAILRKLK